MSQNKTRYTDASVEALLGERGTAQQQADARILIELMQALTQAPPRMWGPSIIGFGSYRYHHASGRSGEAPLTGFAIRGRELVIYLMTGYETKQALLSALGPHRCGKSCLYLKRLADIDLAVLEQLIRDSLAVAKP